MSRGRLVSAGVLARTSPRQIPEQDPFERLLRNLGSVSLCEIIPAHPRAAAAAAGFICALALRAAAARPGAGVVWIAEDMAAREIGLPYGKGLEARDFDPARLVFVKTRSPRETLWAMEEALKSRAVAIVAESWIAPRAYDLTTSRRLLLTARRGGGLGLLLLPRASGEAARLTTAAPLRFEVAASPPPRRRRSGESRRRRRDQRRRCRARWAGVCASSGRAPAFWAPARSIRWLGAS